MTEETTSGPAPVDESADGGGASSIGPIDERELDGWLKHLPPEVVALVAPLHPITSGPEGLEAAKAMTKAMADAKIEIDTIPKDDQVSYRSTRTQENVEYEFASLNAIHEEIDDKIGKHGLSLNCLMNPMVVVLVMRHVEGGMMISWLDLAARADLKETAAQVTMIRRYLTVAMLCLAAEKERGERDIGETARAENARRIEEERRARAAAKPTQRTAATRQPAGRQPGARPQPARQGGRRRKRRNGPRRRTGRRRHSRSSRPTSRARSARRTRTARRTSCGRPKPSCGSAPRPRRSRRRRRPLRPPAEQAATVERSRSGSASATGSQPSR